MNEQIQISEKDLRQKLLQAEFSDGILEIAFGVGLLASSIFIGSSGLSGFAVTCLLAAFGIGQYFRTKYTKKYIGYYKLKEANKKTRILLLLILIPFLLVLLPILSINFLGDVRLGFVHPSNASIFYLVGSLPLVFLSYGGIRYLYAQTKLERFNKASKLIGGIGFIGALVCAFTLRYNFGQTFMYLVSTVAIISGIMVLRDFLKSLKVTTNE